MELGINSMLTQLKSDPWQHVITRGNVEQLLDAGLLEVEMNNGRWWRIRRNGQTKRWKRDPQRIYLPFKAGMKVYGAIETSDFTPWGTLRNGFIRLRTEARA